MLEHVKFLMLSGEGESNRTGNLVRGLQGILHFSMSVSDAAVSQSERIKYGCLHKCIGEIFFLFR